MTKGISAFESEIRKTEFFKALQSKEDALTVSFSTERYEHFFNLKFKNSDTLNQAFISLVSEFDTHQIDRNYITAYVGRSGDTIRIRMRNMPEVMKESMSAKCCAALDAVLAKNPHWPEISDPETLAQLGNAEHIKKNVNTKNEHSYFQGKLQEVFFPTAIKVVSTPSTMHMVDLTLSTPEDAEVALRSFNQAADEASKEMKTPNSIKATINPIHKSQINIRSEDITNFEFINSFFTKLKIITETHPAWLHAANHGPRSNFTSIAPQPGDRTPFDNRDDPASIGA